MFLSHCSFSPLYHIQSMTSYWGSHCRSAEMPRSFQVCIPQCIQYSSYNSRPCLVRLVVLEDTSLSLGQDTSPSLGQDTNPSLGQDTNPSLGQDTNPSLGKDTNPSFGQDTSPSLGQDQVDCMSKWGMVNSFSKWLNFIHKSFHFLENTWTMRNNHFTQPFFFGYWISILYDKR